MLARLAASIRRSTRKASLPGSRSSTELITLSSAWRAETMVVGSSNLLPRDRGEKNRGSPKSVPFLTASLLT